jgi:hypothetical protein
MIEGRSIENPLCQFIEWDSRAGLKSIAASHTSYGALARPRQRSNLNQVKQEKRRVTQEAFWGFCCARLATSGKENAGHARLS